MGTALEVILSTISLALRKKAWKRDPVCTRVRETAHSRTSLRHLREKGKCFQAPRVRGCSFCCTHTWEKWEWAQERWEWAQELLPPPVRDQGPALSVQRHPQARAGPVIRTAWAQRNLLKTRRASPRTHRAPAPAGSPPWPGAALPSSRARAGANPTFAATVGKPLFAIRGSLGTRQVTRERGPTSAPSVTKPTGGRITC